MKIIETEIQISASPEKVWSILTDLETYPEWNPFITRLNGPIKTDKKLEVQISPPNGKTILFNPIVKSVIENQELSWLGRLLFPGVFDGEHIFKIEANASGCLFIQKEKFSGLLVPLLWRSLNKKTRSGFEQMNQALKKKVENA